MNHNNEREENLTTTLSSVAPGDSVRLHHMAVQLDEVDQLGPCDNRGSAAYGFGLTRVAYRRNGKRRQRIFLSHTPVELLAA